MYGFGAPQALTVGGLGSVYITDTAAHTTAVEGPAYVYGCIIAHEAAVAALVTDKFGAPEGVAAANGRAVTQGTLTAVVLPVGVPMFGAFSSITLASGKVTAYFA